MDVREMLKKGRGQLLEFMPRPEPMGLAETIAAFANADGGTVLLGMGSSGAVLVEVIPEHVEGILLRAETLIAPPVPIEWQTLDTAGGTAIAIAVPRSPRLHSLTDGRVLLRSGPRNRPLTGEEVRHLATSKGAGDWEQETVAGASPADLDAKIISEYAAKRQLRSPRGERLEGLELLRDAGAVDQNESPTVAGILLFARNPQRLLVQSGAVFVRFGGSEPGGRTDRPGYMRREEITGPLSQVIERLWSLILEEMRRESLIVGLERQEVFEYPPAAVREAIVNAVAHRDYRRTGSRIEVRMYDDRLEIISPGGLPGHITVDNIVDEHFSRNPRLVRGLFYWGFIEELGLGIDRMIDEMTRAGHPRPTFDAQPHSFRVVLRNARARRPAHWLPDLNERQVKALTLLEERGRITNRDYQGLCPDVTPETLRLDLVDLVSRDILLRIGDKKGTYYILK